MALNIVKDSAISYIVELAVGKLISCLENRIGSVLGIEEEAEKTKSAMVKIQKVIGGAEDKPVKDEELIDWLRRLKDVAYDAEDVLDEYLTEEQRRNVESKDCTPVRDPITNKVRKLTSSLLNPILNRPKMASRIKEVRERLEAIEEENHSKFHLSERIIQWEKEFGHQRQTHSFVNEPQVFGRDEDKKKIVKLLLEEVRNEDENVVVIPIVGIGGLGKTTLTQLVFNDQNVQSHFELKIWICVSDDFDALIIAKRIISCIIRNNYDISEPDIVQRRLRELLDGRRFLLVLDDVWNEEPDKWNRLRCLLLCGAKHSRIVVTTRSPIIATIMSKVAQYRLDGLSENDCWSLFSQRAFFNQREEQEYPNLVAVGREIVSKCRGVPLAVKTLAGLLFFKREEREWESIRDNEMWQLVDESVLGILPALRLSFKHLKPHLRQCFAFCAIFPKDYEMEKERLIELWMANGFLPYRSGMELEDIGNEIFNELVARSFFEGVKVNGLFLHFQCVYHDSTIVKMHDLVHDLAQSVMESECCNMTDKLSREIRRTRYLSHQLEYFPKEIFSSLDAQRLRTVVQLPFDSCSTSIKKELPHDIQRFNFLRVLDLRSYVLKPCLNAIGNLKHLRYLDLSRSSFETLPESISRLQNLQTLKLFQCVKLRELPKDIRNMINLRYLDISGCSSLSHMPARLGQISSLQVLTWFVVGSNASESSELRELQSLKLRGSLAIRGLQCVTMPSDAREANMAGKPNLHSLFLLWSEEHQAKDVEEEVLKELKPHQNLKRLWIRGYGGVHYPNWMMGCWLTKLEEITLSYCKRCVHLPPLGQLPLLRVLSISDMDVVECIGNEFYGNSMSKGFPVLIKLEIVSMPNLKEWSGLEGKESFPNLLELVIVDCPTLTTVPFFPSLEDLCLQETDSAILRSVANCNSLSSLTVDTLSGITSLPQGMMQNLTNLKSLNIINCERPSCLIIELQNITSLERMHLEFCHGIQWFPEGEELIGCIALRELEIVALDDLVSLTDGAQYLTDLRRLTINCCPKLENLTEGIRHLTSLQYCSIQDCPSLKRLPEGIGNLSSLRELSIFDISVASFPESMQQLTALQTLEIRACGQLESLPRGLNALQNLSIFGCPQLKELYEPERGRDWKMIQHIPNIKIQD